MKRRRNHRKDARRSTAWCEVCGVATKEGKPYCSEHVDELPYVKKLHGQVSEYEEEEIKLQAGIKLAKSSPVLLDILRAMREGVSAGRAATFFGATPEAVEKQLKMHKIPTSKRGKRGLVFLKNPRKRSKKSNPLLAIVGCNPRKKRKNFDLSSKPTSKAGKGVRQVGEISLSEAKKVLSPKAYTDAVNAYKKFHGYEPTRITVYEVPDGSQRTEAVVTLGLAPEMHYFVPPDQKTNKNEEGETHWVHHTKDGEQPALVYNPLTQMTMYLPPAKGGFRVDDFLRESDE